MRRRGWSKIKGKEGRGFDVVRVVRGTREIKVSRENGYSREK